MNSDPKPDRSTASRDTDPHTVRKVAAHDMRIWLKPWARIAPAPTPHIDEHSDAMLDGALDAIERFYQGKPDDAIRPAAIAVSLTSWLDLDGHLLASVLASAVVRLVRARRRTPVENLLAPLLAASIVREGRPAKSARDEVSASEPRAARNGTPTPTVADQERFADAQARLDEGDYPPGEAGRAQEAEDKRFADWYDQAVNGAAQDEFERQRDEAEFRSHYPEPADGTRIEWEGSDGVMQAAARIDYPDEPGNWWVHGQADAARTWRQLVVEYGIPADLVGVVFLTESGQPTASADADERDRARSSGYVHGLRQASSWLRLMTAAPVVAGLDATTLRHLTAGVDAMARSAAERLNVEGA